MFTTGKKALDYLENNELSREEHLRLLGILNKSINSFPLEDVVQFTQDGATLVNGRKLNLEETVNFRQGISAIRDNWAFKLLADQVLFLAITHGIHYGDGVDKIMFSKTAIWFITQFRKFLEKFDI